MTANVSSAPETRVPYELYTDELSTDEANEDCTLCLKPLVRAQSDVLSETSRPPKPLVGHRGIIANMQGRLIHLLHQKCAINLLESGFHNCISCEIPLLPDSLGVRDVAPQFTPLTRIIEQEDGYQRRQNKLCWGLIAGTLAGFLITSVITNQCALDSLGIGIGLLAGMGSRPTPRAFPFLNAAIKTSAIAAVAVMALFQAKEMWCMATLLCLSANAFRLILCPPEEKTQRIFLVAGGIMLILLNLQFATSESLTMMGKVLLNGGAAMALGRWVIKPPYWPDFLGLVDALPAEEVHQPH